LRNFKKIIRGKERIRKRERESEKREKESKQLKKYLRLKFQDSLCAAEEHKVYQQSATGSLRGEIAFSFAKKKKIGMCVLDWTEKESWGDCKKGGAGFLSH